MNSTTMTAAKGARMDNFSAGEVGGIFAGVVTLIGTMIAGLAKLLNWHGERTDAKAAKLTRWEASLSAREKELREITEARLEALEGRLKVVETAYTLVVGVTHVMVDDLIVLNPRSASLTMVLKRIRETYPLPEDMPSELAHLAARLSAGHEEIEP